MTRNYYDSIQMLEPLGITYEDAAALRRISMTLHRWHELECGDSSEYASFCLVRGKRQGDGSFIHDDNGKPYVERHYHSSRGPAKPTYSPMADREAGAIKRLKAIMDRYPTLSYYVQGDPRGAALYILRPGDVPEGKEVDAYYSRGIAVCK